MLMSDIKLFESKKNRSAWNDDKEKWYFSVQDVVEILTDSADIKQYIKKLKSRDPQLFANRGTICTLVEMTAPKSHTHCLAAHATHIQSQSKSVLSAV